MKNMYKVIRFISDYDWDRKEIVCVTSDEQTARLIVEWLRDNDNDRDPYYDYRYDYWYSKVPVVDTYEQFIKDHIEINSED